MIGAYAEHAPIFLRAVAVLTIAAVGVPLTIAPLRWAKVLRWTIPEHTHLAIYFGRCLGAVICVLGAGALVAARDPGLASRYCALVLGCALAMIAVHAWGALRRIQPATETWEILGWIGLAIASALFV